MLDHAPSQKRHENKPINPPTLGLAAGMLPEVVFIPPRIEVAQHTGVVDLLGIAMVANLLAVPPHLEG